MKTLEDLNKEEPLHLVQTTTLSELLEAVPTLLKTRVVQHTWPLKFGKHRIKIELQVIVGSEAVVWTGPKTLLLARKRYLCLSRKKFLAVLFAGAGAKWKWKENHLPPEFLDACLDLLENIPSLSDAPDLATEQTPELAPLETELQLV